MSFFAKNLRFLRDKRGLSAPAFAELLDIWEDTLNRFEKGKEEADYDSLIRIAHTLGVPIDHLLKRNMELQSTKIQAKHIKFILLDVDGTLTDGGMFYSEKGDEFRQFNSHDGMAIHRMITRHNMRFGLISSGSTENIVHNRAEKLGISHVYCGTRPKKEIIDQWLDELRLAYKHIVFIGDDLNDLEMIKKAGVSACPANAVSQVRQAADVVLKRGGGQGCIREFIEEVLNYDLNP
ncbi:MAG: HAD-IA family hydrolase [Bacteroidota bacterium]